jgi:multidrug efflux system membrane fusion protein
MHATAVDSSPLRRSFGPRAAQSQAQQAAAAVSGVDALVAQRAIVTAEIAIAGLNLEFTTVRAPFDGRVVSRPFRAGST